MGGNISESFERLYQALYAELVDYFEHRLPDPAEAEDFTQQTFERLLQKDEVREPANLARLIAAGLLKNTYRDAETGAVEGESATLSYEVLIGDDGEGLDHLPQFQTPSYDDLAFAEEHDLAVRSLEIAPRDAYILGELRGLKSREAATVLGVSHTTAAARRVEATIAIREGIAA